MGLVPEGAVGGGRRLVPNSVVRTTEFGQVIALEAWNLRAGSAVEGGGWKLGVTEPVPISVARTTRIGTGTKIDNLVQIGHNCKIGKHNLLVSQVGIAGSCTTGDYVVMAGQVGVADHVTVGERTTIGAKAAVPKDVPPNSRMLGYPARPDRETLRILMASEKLPDMVKDVRRIKKHLGLEDSE